jgi:hypothetical protein
MERPNPLPKSRFLDIGEHEGALTFSLARCFAESLGLRLRRQEACGAARSSLKSVGSVSWLTEGQVLILDGGEAAGNSIAAVLRRIDRRLERIAVRPLGARMVEEALGITARERSRWTKDGRLTRAGTELIRRHQLIALSTYAVDEIARLTAEPETIRAWRDADAWRAKVPERQEVAG